MLELVDRLPTVAEYSGLRRAVEWRGVEDAAAGRALDGSLFGVCAAEDERTVGMARVVGDGSLYFYIQDVVVDPQWQGRGIGRRMVQRLEVRVADQASQGAHLLLVAASGVVNFYATLGYTRLPDDVLGKRINSG